MKEVSCRAFAVMHSGFRRKGLPVGILTRGLPHDLKYLQNKHERMDWSTYCLMMKNAREVLTPQDFENIGRAFAESPLARPVSVIAGLFLTPHDMFKLMRDDVARVAHQMFSCVTMSVAERGPDRIDFWGHIDPGYEFCPELFLITKGTISATPRVLGLGYADVEMYPIERGVRLEIHYPKGHAVFGWVWKFFLWPRAAIAAGREAKEAHEVMTQRYAELDAARTKLDRQATQLKTAHTISQLVRHSLALDATLDAVAKALVGEAGFSRSEISLTKDAENNPLVRNVTYGAAKGETAVITVPVVVHALQVGELRLWPKPDADLKERGELLEYVIPSVFMAIADALTFNAVVDFRDNLERKVAERTQELEKARDELAGSVVKLEEAQSVRERIFANINHEIRTPLSLVTLATAEVRRQLGAAAAPIVLRRLGDIDTSAGHLLELVEGLLLLASAQEGRLRMHSRFVDVTSLARQLVSAWTPLAESYGVRLGLDVSTQCMADVDERGFNRMITNLVSNAVKFTPKDGQVTVRINRVGESLRLEVADTGIGVDPEVRKHLFERFVEGQRAVHPGFHSTGVGLAIVRELARAHGGEAGHLDNPGGGSCFFVELPQRRAHESGQAASIATGVMIPAPFERLDGARLPVARPKGPTETTILVAEDDPVLLDSIVRLLADVHRVLPARDGMEALKLAQDDPPDLLVTDLGMPYLDGLELIRRFRDLPGNRLVPVIILTAYGDLAHRLKGFDAGAIDFVSKPFAPEELLARVRSQLLLRDIALKLHESEKAAAIGVLASGLAHELRNPANVVANAIEPLRRYLPANLLEPQHPVAQLFQVVEANAARLADLSRELLGLGSGAQVTVIEQSFASILDEVMQTIGNTWPEISIRRDVGFIGNLWCMRPLIIQALFNLLDNGAHAAGPRGELGLTVSRQGDDLLIDVSDNGPGIPAALRQKIFEPFFTTKQPGVGTGLGLTMARIYIDKHHGTLQLLDSEHGAAFRIRLPIRGQQGALVAGTRERGVAG